MFWIFIVGLGLAWVAQSILSFKQTQAFTKLFVELRKRGRVAMGKFHGGLVQGAIVMFVLDDDGVITEGRRLNGVSVLARFRDFDEFNGSHIADLDVSRAASFGRSTLKAVANARDNYKIIIGGGQAPEPPTALARTLGGVSRLRSKPAPSTPCQPSPTTGRSQSSQTKYFRNPKARLRARTASCCPNPNPERS